MNSPVFDRGPSERFAELLDEVSGHRRRHRRHRADGDLAPLVRLSARLSAEPLGQDPDPEFRDNLRAMLMSKIDRDGIGITAEQTVSLTDPAIAPGARYASSASGRTRIAMIAGVMVGAVALSGVSVASADALPGDPLYQVKRSSERAQLALAGSDLSRGQLYLQFARGRLTEARSADAPLLSDLFADMDTETQQGVSTLAAAAAQKGDTAALDIVLRFVAQQRDRLRDLRLPQAEMRLPAQSLALLDTVEARTVRLRAALHRGCTAGPIDSLGPKPGC